MMILKLLIPIVMFVLVSYFPLEHLISNVFSAFVWDSLNILILKPETKNTVSLFKIMFIK